MGVCSLNLDQLINNRAYGVVRAPLERSSDLSASIDFSVQTIFVESIDETNQPQQSKHTIKADKEQNRYGTPKDNKDQTFTPSNGNSKVSNNSSSENSNNMTPKRSIGKFSKVKRSQKVSEGITEKYSLARYSGVSSASKHLLDMLRSPEAKKNVAEDVRSRQKPSNLKQSTSYRPSYDFSVNLSSQKQSGKKEMTEPIESASQTDKECGGVDWEDKFRVLSSRLVLSEIEKESLMDELEKLRSCCFSRDQSSSSLEMEAQQTRIQISSFQNRVSALQSENVQLTSQRDKIALQLTNTKRLLKESDMKQLQLSERLQDATSSLHAVKLQLDQQRSHSSGLTKQLESAEAQLASYKEMQEKLEFNHNSLQDQVVSLQTSLEVEQQKKRELSEQLTQVMEINNREKAELEHKLIKTAESATEHSQRSVVLGSALAQQKSEIGEYAIMLDREKQMRQSQTKLYQLEREGLQQENSKLSEHLERLKSQLAQKSDDIKRLLMETQTPLTELVNLKNHLTESQNELEQANQRLEGIAAEKRKAESTVDHLRLQLAQEQGKQLQLIQEATKMAKLKQDTQAIFQEQMDSNLNSMRSLEKQVERANSKLEEQRSILERVERQLGMMLESMGECVTPLITVNNKPCNEQFNSQVLNLLHQVEGCFEKIVQTSKLELDRSNEQLMRAVDSLASKERDIQRANQDERSSKPKQVTMVDSHSQTQPMNTNSKELEKQIEALTQLSRDKEIQHVEELSSLRHHYEAMTPDQMWKSQPLERNPPNQNLKVESTNSSTLVELEKQIATLTAHAHELEIKLKESGSERQGLQEQFDQMATANNKLQYKMLALTALNSQHEKQLARLRNEIQQLTANSTNSPRTGSSFLLVRRNSATEETASEQIATLKRQLSHSQQKQSQMKKSNQQLQEKFSEQSRHSQQLVAELEYVIGACGIINNKLQMHIDPTSSSSANWNSQNEKLSDLFAKHLEFNIQKLIKAHRLAEQFRSKLQQDLEAAELKVRELTHQMHQQSQKHHLQATRLHEQLHELRLLNAQLENERDQLGRQIANLKDRKEEYEAQSLYFTDLSRLDVATAERNDIGVQISFDTSFFNRERTLDTKEAAMQTDETREQELPANVNEKCQFAVGQHNKRLSIDSQELMEEDMNLSAVESQRVYDPPDTIDYELDRLDIRDSAVWQKGNQRVGFESMVRQHDQLRRQLQDEVSHLRSLLKTVEEEHAHVTLKLSDEVSQLGLRLQHVRNTQTTAAQKVQELQRIHLGCRSVFVEICRTESQAKHIIDYFKQVQGVINDIFSLIGTKHS